MNQLLDRISALCGLSLLLAALCIGQLVHAQDEPPCPPSVGGTVQCADHPIFSKLPLAADYLHRVIANDKGEITIYLKKMPDAEVLQQVCPNAAACNETGCASPCTKLGCGQSDTAEDNALRTRQTIVIRRFPSQPGEIIDMRHVRSIERRLHDTPFLAEPLPEFPIDVAGRFVRVACPCAAAGECVCAAHATCGEDCSAARADDCKCCPCAVEAAEAKCGEDTCEEADCLIRRVEHFEQATEYDPLKLMQHIAGLVGEKAAAQAALVVRKEADEKIGELVETLAELLADNAALDAKLEAASEQHKLLEKIANLATENARLKTHVELAAERAEVARSSAALTLENERLKLRLAELEQKHALAEAARTAARPKDRKAR